MCSWVISRGELAPEGFEAAEWQRLDTLCEGLEGVPALAKADALLCMRAFRLRRTASAREIRDDIETLHLCLSLQSVSL